MLLRKKNFRKLCSGAMLIVFCTVIIISQAPNFKIPNTKSTKFTIDKQSRKGPGGLTNENQNNPVNSSEEEEDDDEFKLELAVLKIYQQEFIDIKHFSIQDGQLRDPHREIFSPPPQA